MQNENKATMQAMVIESYGDPEKLVLQEVPMPKPGVGEILIKIRAFGLNHAETYMRRGIWENSVPIIGIECVGEVEQDPSGVLQKGTTVAAIMGGMGRTRNGSYAEYTSVPATNVFALKTKMAWADLAALPESYATAWACLFENLRLTEAKGDAILLVRGATSGLGQAALNIAARHHSMGHDAKQRQKTAPAIDRCEASADRKQRAEQNNARVAPGRN